MKTLIAAILLSIIAIASVRADDDDTLNNPNMRGCNVTMDNPIETALAEKIMPLNLPYEDGQRLLYFGGDSAPLGYSVRHALRIYFYDASGLPLGTAIRRTEENTAYFSNDGQFLGICRRHTMMTPQFHPYDPRLNPNEQ